MISSATRTEHANPGYQQAATCRAVAVAPNPNQQRPNVQELAARESGVLRSRGNKGSISLLLVMLSASMLLPGCNVCQLAKRTLRGEPSEYWWFKDRKESVQVYRVWADNAWCDLCAEDPDQNMSPAYVAGFKDGFVDYVFAGGAGEPPPVPPRQYWNVEERNPRGHESATDWFAGFRHGAQLAKEEGYRERAIVPASIFLKNSHLDRETCAPGCLTPVGPDGQPLPAGIVQPELVRPMIVKPPASGANIAPPASGGNIAPKSFTTEGLNSPAPATEPMPLPSRTPAEMHLGVPPEADATGGGNALEEPRATPPQQPFPGTTPQESPQPFPATLPGVEDNNPRDLDVDEVFDTREFDFSSRQLRRQPPVEPSLDRSSRPRSGRLLMTKPLRPRAIARPVKARRARTAAARTAAAIARAEARSKAAEPARERAPLVVAQRTKPQPSQTTPAAAKSAVVPPLRKSKIGSAAIPLPSGRSMGLSPQFSR